MTNVTLPYACTIPDLVNLVQHEVPKSFYSDSTTCAFHRASFRTWSSYLNLLTYIQTARSKMTNVTLSYACTMPILVNDAVFGFF